MVKNNKGPSGFGNGEVVACSWKTGFGGCTAEWYGLIWLLIARGIGKGYNSFRVGIRADTNSRVLSGIYVGG